MQKFNINEIEFQEDEVAPLEQLLTGEVIKGIDPNSQIEPNAEVEDGEQLQFPDGTVQRAVGEDHEKGGVKVVLPDGTLVLSNHLKLNTDQAKRLKKQFEIDVTTKDTYAQALDKYVKKIGLSKLYEDQEQTIKTLKEVLEKDSDPNTLRVNKAYLTGKIKDIEDQKKDKEVLKKAFFDKVFDMQETTKPKGQEQEGFALGGVSRQNFKKVCEKYGLTENQALEFLGLKQYADGGETGDDPSSGRFRLQSTPTSFSDPTTYERVEQSKTSAGFGKITKENLPQVLMSLYKNFPDIVSSSDVFNISFDENGNIQYNENINFSEASQEVKRFQEKAKVRMEETADVVIKNPDIFGEDVVKQAEEFKKNETFDASKARAVDALLGNFTSGRFNLGLDVVTPEELKALSEKNIFTVNQLKKAVDDGTVTDLSETSIQRLNEIAGLQKGTNADFSLFNVEPVSTPVQAPEEIPTQAPTTPVNPLLGIQDNVVVSQSRNYPRLFYTPDQTGLPPSPMEAVTMTENTFGRIDPVRVGIDQNLQQIANDRQFVAKQLENLPSGQRASALATLLATSQQNINQAATETNRINAQNQSQAELFNIGQADRENIARSQNVLNYEQRALLTKSKTEEQLRNWIDRNQTVALNNFQNQQRLNLMNSLFPDYQLDFMGASVSYNPSSQWQVQDRSDYLRLFGQSA